MPIALIDSSTKTLLALSDQPSTIVFLLECTIDTDLAANVHFPNYLESSFFTTLPSARFPEWTWVGGDRRFVRTMDDVLTPELRKKSALAHAKGVVFYRIMTILNVARYKLQRGVDFQDAVYIVKRLQAQQFKELNDEGHISRFPYVAQYAEYKGMPYMQAADEILFKARLDDYYLARTETLRLKYSNHIKIETDPEKLTPLYDTCYRECFSNAVV